MDALMRQAAQLIEARGVQPADTVVLLPYFHLLSLARDAWGRVCPDGFAPRIETTMTWSSLLPHVPRAHDHSGEPGRDLVTARSLLERAGLGARADLLAGHVVEAASQLAPLAAAIGPEGRSDWAAQMRRTVAGDLRNPVLALEAAVAAVAIEWVAASSFRTDGLLSGPGPRLLVVVEGLRREPVTEGIAARLRPGQVGRLALGLGDGRASVALHEAADPADEAERAAACVLRHIAAGRVPVALPAIDRVLARRMRAMLEQRGAAIQDETGWKLSTTRAGAHVMLALRACAWPASSDQVIDWLKNAPACPNWSVLALERRVRRAGVRDWRSVQLAELGEALQPLAQQVTAWREGARPARSLQAWLDWLRGVLDESGQWAWLEKDVAGRDVIRALRLEPEDAEEIAQWPGAGRRLGLPDFTAWANECLEAASFVPPAAAQPQVVLLPFHQLLGRPFAALVLAGCDEVRLPASPEPGGPWTPPQRAALGLATREALEAEQRSLWAHALRTPACDVLWRRTDDSGEAVMPSPLVQPLIDEEGLPLGTDAREARSVDVQPVARTGAVGAALAVASVSASAYEDLRRCPYRFFALRQLGLQEPDEIDQDLDKRDFGNWLHQVLRQFHERLQQQSAEGEARRALIDEVADEVTRSLRLPEGDFLPFQAAWPQVREGYLQWLAEYEAKEGAQFVGAETEHRIALGPLQLMGRIDRIDRARDGQRIVMDYKTESQRTTKERIDRPAEDTQLAFYAALLADDTLRAAYVNIGERGDVKWMEQAEVVAARDLLVEGMLEDVRRIAAGDSMQPMGEGMVCDFCAARGLCRRDWWA